MPIKDFWTPDRLREAAKLLQAAYDTLQTTHPYTIKNPNPYTLPAVETMIDTAIKCALQARPQSPGRSEPGEGDVCCGFKARALLEDTK
jgi:hypothetical protein